MNARLTALTVGVAVAAFGAGGLSIRALQRHEPTERERRAALVARAEATIRRNFVDSIPADTLYLSATREMVQSLHDPYAELLLADAYRRFNQQMSGTRIQIGAPSDAREGGALKGYGLGFTTSGREIAPGDEVVSIDGHSTRGMSDVQATNLIAADTSSLVTLVVRPRGTETDVVRRIPRTAIHLPAVSPGVMLANGAGYVALHAVTQASASELRAAITGLRTRGARSLVLDLRRNPGGLITQGVEIAALFLDQGDTIAVMRGRAGAVPVAHVAAAAQAWPGMPVVLLVNRQTASSAEVIAAALQDHDRALIVGTPTFGKGVVQTTYPLENETAIKFTTARWFAPSGRSIQRVPDSVALDLPEFHSEGGRVLRGGGGVLPDLVARPRFYDPESVALAREVRSAPSAFRSAVAEAAAAIVRREGLRRNDFVVTDSMRETLWQELLEREVPADRVTFDAGATLIDRELGFAIARLIGGEAGEIARRAADDRITQVALDTIERGLGARTARRVPRGTEWR